MPRKTILARWGASLHGAVLALGGCRMTLPENHVVLEIPFYVKDTTPRDEVQEQPGKVIPEEKKWEAEPKFHPPEGMGEAFRNNKVPEECFGARVNLHRTHACRCRGEKMHPDRSLQISYCGDAFYEEVDLTDAIDVRLVPYTESVAVGEFVQVDLIILNETDTVLPIMLAGEISYSFDFIDVLRVVNEAGVDVTRKGLLAGGSRGGDVLFALEPGGEARLPMMWSPVTIVGEMAGSPPRKQFRPEKLPPGEYTLSFKVPFFPAKVTDAQRVPSTKITVLPEKPAAAKN